MSVAIKKMTEEAFASFYQWSIVHHAQELMEESHISREDAMKEAITEVTGMLPDGLHTKNHHLMTIIEEFTGEHVGFIWTIHEKTEGRKQSFLCDFAIWEQKRRKGYGAAALHLAEAYAAQAGCRESVLFVEDRNTAANALYEKCGYRFLRQEGCGKYMIKQLP